ncbi:KilA-N domain-containing protein [Neisseria sp. ZJ106]|uniref:KilA-N domain-containing protein n=1 Tax=Neisseria lisongii TaxID=2912188 RepID=A0ABY7RIY7_9NEIS|nr:KilA-N domain-containing protein [Neisseria lisongii]MCF7520448.1 KilA-N domain-containing protein [Neisseria lisongii]WCL71609.1 KilA-N domain-containing protein [Neisseria lisongii]
MNTITLNYHDTPLTTNGEAWFNATEIAAMFGKQVYEWLRLPETEKYIAALCKREEEKQVISNTGFSRITKSSFIRSRRGNNGGTWLHPKLAVAFARWCNVEFAVWCDEQIDTLIRQGKSWQSEREASKIGYQVMSEILQAKRQAEGKATQSHHYSNEALLCNEALTGRRQALDRNSLNQHQLAALARLEARNAALIGQSIPYQERKALLFKLAAPYNPAFQTACKPR